MIKMHGRPICACLLHVCTICACWKCSRKMHFFQFSVLFDFFNFFFLFENTLKFWQKETCFYVSKISGKYCDFDVYSYTYFFSLSLTERKETKFLERAQKLIIVYKKILAKKKNLYFICCCLHSLHFHWPLLMGNCLHGFSWFQRRAQVLTLHWRTFAGSPRCWRYHFFRQTRHSALPLAAHSSTYLSTPNST